MKKRLVILPDLKHHSKRDFKIIKKRIKTLAPDIDVIVCSYKSANFRLSLRKNLPTLFVSLRHLYRWKPKSGRLLHGEDLTKTEQLDRLNQAGFKQPKHCKVSPSTHLDPEQWGQYVVVKPEIGCRGAKVRIMKTSKVKYDKFPQDSPTFVQDFVYTGPQPTSYRVNTFFGAALYIMKSTNINCGEKLINTTNTKSFAGHNIVATARDGEVSLVNDEEIKEYAEQIAKQVFPNIPALGIDVLRNYNTGELSISEVNPWGGTWHFSSKLGKGIQESLDQNFEDQFGAFDITALALIKKVNELAE